jgi:hypothetical protein
MYVRLSSLTVSLERLTYWPLHHEVEKLFFRLFGLIKHDVTIHTFFPERTYDRKSLNSGQIWELMAQIERAHGESKRKSDLGRACWNQKRRLAREEGRVLTRAVPAWLRVTEDGKFERIPRPLKPLAGCAR